jgi:hypothetical protein
MEENIEETPERLAQKARVAALARARTARLRALGLNARGKPLKDRHKNRDLEKQKMYQANYGRKHKAARERLGLTISQFQKLPRAVRLKELNVDQKERIRARQRDWYRQNKAKAGVAKATPNGVLPVDDRSVKFCPHCGWNIDALRKAQAFIDGRVA